LDIGDFKERRSLQLQDKAEDAADEALRTRSPVVMGLMTPAARREIHLALADDPGVETESDGEGFLKRVVVHPRRRR
jgi:spoIIIJ-associated protein